MNKEQAARQYVSGGEHGWGFKDENDCSESKLCFDGFVAGWDQGQKQLLSEAAKDYKQWLRSQYPNSYLGHDIGEDRSKDAWQASRLSVAEELAAKDKEIERLNFLLSHFSEKEKVVQGLSAELAAKDEEIKELKKKTGFRTGFYVRECNNCGHDWSRDD